MEGYESLRFAIVERAANDYMHWRKDLYYFSKGAIYKRYSSSTTTSERVEQLKGEINRIRNFFTSQWFYELCSMDGLYILNRLDEEFEEWAKKNLRKQKIGV